LQPAAAWMDGMRCCRNSAPLFGGDCRGLALMKGEMKRPHSPPCDGEWG